MKATVRQAFRWLVFGILAVLIFAAVPAADKANAAQETGAPQPVAITLNLTRKTLANDGANNTFELRISGARYGGSAYHGIPQQVAWSCSRQDLLTITPDPADPARCMVSVSGGATGVCAVEASCGTAKASCQVTVRQAIPATKISLNKKKATLYLGSDGPKSALQLTPRISPATASAATNPSLIEWRSSKPSRATVDENGVVTPLAPGKVTIKAVLKDGSKKQVSCKLTIKPVQPSAVKVSPLTLEVGRSGAIEAAVSPADALDKRLSFKSSNPKIAKVSKDGVVTAVKPGKATITCTTKSGKRKAKCQVQVVSAPASPLSETAPSSGGSGGSGASKTQRYFFYGIGNADYPDMFAFPSALEDLKIMNALYGQARFSGATVTKTIRENLSAAQIEEFLGDMATQSGATQNDVTIFYYSGRAQLFGGDQGALLGAGPSISEYVTIDRVCELLDRVPGTVVVILECPMSGNYLTGKATAASPASAKAFTDSVLNSFKRSANNNALTGKALGDAAGGKYKVLTACGAGEMTNLLSGATQMGMFTDCIDKGLSGDNPADKNRDGKTTLHELYDYVSGEVSQLTASHSEPQTVGVWPKNDDFVVYSRD